MNDKQREEETDALRKDADAIWQKANELTEHANVIEAQTLKDWEDLQPSLVRGSQSTTKEVQSLYENVRHLVHDVSGRNLELLREFPDIIKRFESLDVYGKTLAYRAAVKAVDVDKIANEQTLELLRAQEDTIVQYGPKWQVSAASVYFASFQVSVGYRDVQAACLDRRHPSEVALSIGLGLLKNFTVDLVTKNNPVVGPVIGAATVIAENTKADVDRKLEATAAALDELAKIGLFRDALMGLKTALADSASLVQRRVAAIETLDREFNDAYGKSMSILSTARRGES